MQAVVALKSPRTAKSRLAAILEPARRRELFFTLARTVIEALNATRRIDRVVVVTSSIEVAGFASDLGCDALRQNCDLGTAAAFQAGVDYLRPHPALCAGRVIS